MKRKMSRFVGFFAAAVVSCAAMGVPAHAVVVEREPEDTHFKAPDGFTLHVHKHESANPAATMSPEGTATATGAPIANVEFTAFRLLDPDGRDVSNWPKIREMKPTQDWCKFLAAGDEEEAGFLETDDTSYSFDIFDPVKATTNDEGVADFKFEEKQPQSWLICETKAPADVLTVADPFIVSFPFPHDGKWLTEVHAYPKNTRGSATKSISEQTSFGENAEVKFPVTGRFGALNEGERYTTIQVLDTLPAGLERVGVESVKIAGQAATAETDYKVGKNGNTVVVTLTPEGLKKMPGTGGEVEVVFTGRAFAPGQMKNTAYFYSQTQKVPNGEIPPNEAPPVNPDKPVKPEDPSVPAIPTNEVTTTWGTLKLIKKDVGSELGLNNAEFEIYPAKNPYPDSEGECTTEIADEAEAIETKRTRDGEISFNALYVSDSVNDKKDAPFRCYVLKETKAPKGYVLPDQPLTAVAVKADPGDNEATEITITNTPLEVPDLPLTGANGRLLLMSIGGALALLSAGYVVVALRRRRS